MKNQLLLLGFFFVFITACSKKNDPAATAPVNNNATTTNQGNHPKFAGKSDNTISGSIHYTFTTSFDLPCDCGTYTSAGNFYGTGILTHLGLSTSKIKPCLSPIYSGPVQIGEHVGVECNTLTAANGDELYCNILPYDVLFSGVDAVGTIDVDITGGTGIFSGATGHFSGLATVHLTLGTADLTGINGTINY
jgi:hypothetical protein